MSVIQTKSPATVSCLVSYFLSPVYSLQSYLKSKRRYSDRPIDIDILLYDDLVVDEPDLKIPHPLMEQRDFVMTPLNEIKARD